MGGGGGGCEGTREHTESCRAYVCVMAGMRHFPKGATTHSSHRHTQAVVPGARGRHQQCAKKGERGSTKRKAAATQRVLHFLDQGELQLMRECILLKTKTAKAAGHVDQSISDHLVHKEQTLEKHSHTIRV